MGQYKYLAKNVGLLSLSNFATKLLSFFLVPLYTNVLSTEEYGTYDLFNTTVGVLLPILTLNIQDAILRFTLDNKTSRKAIVTIGAEYFILSNIIIIVGLSVNSILGISILFSEYAIFFFLMYFAQSLSTIVMAYIRGIDRIADLSASSVICSAAIIISNILFLLVFRWGIVGYFLANIIGPCIQCIYLLSRALVFQDLKPIQRYGTERKEMLSYSVPMIANGIAWWINNAADKYIILWICGLAENGIYSVASKIPSILNVFQTIFSQAWTLSAVKDFDPEDKSGFFATTYAIYNCGLTIVCSCIILFDRFLAHLLYAKDFYTAWRYVPWLTIAIIFGSLSGYIGGFYTAAKKPKMFAQSTMMGAGVNVVLNIVMTPFMGALGAAIATTASYFIIWVFRFIHSRKIIKLQVKIKRDILSYIILIVQSIGILFIEKTIWLYAFETCFFSILLALYMPEMKLIIVRMLKFRRNKH